MANASSLPFLLLSIFSLLLTFSLFPAAAPSTRERNQSSTTALYFDLDLNSNEFEISRRILASKQYISYGALQANRVPCSQKGASYYNCVPGSSANPYNRGCSSITRCRR